LKDFLYLLGGAVWLAAFPIHDVQEEPFRLEDYIVKFYGSRES